MHAHMNMSSPSPSLSPPSDAVSEGLFTIIMTATICVWFNLWIISFVDLRNLRKFLSAVWDAEQRRRRKERVGFFGCLIFFALCMNELISRLKERENWEREVKGEGVKGKGKGKGKSESKSETKYDYIYIYIYLLITRRSFYSSPSFYLLPLTSYSLSLTFLTLSPLFFILLTSYRTLSIQLTTHLF